MNLGCESPTSSSPPTPPSPLPISFGPDNRTYSFSVSSTPSPPFSLPPSSHPSEDNLPLLYKTLDDPNVPSVFSLDHQYPQEFESKTTCLKDLFDSFRSNRNSFSPTSQTQLIRLEWFIQRCCSCCNKSP